MLRKRRHARRKISGRRRRKSEENLKFATVWYRGSTTVSNNLVSFCIDLHRRMEFSTESYLWPLPVFLIPHQPVVKPKQTSSITFRLRSPLHMHLRTKLPKPRPNIRSILDVVPERIGRHLHGLTAQVVCDFVAID